MTKFITKSARAVAAAGAMYLTTVQAVVASQPVVINPPRSFATDFGTLVSSVLRLVFVIAALLVLFYLVLGGIEYITSGGDKGKTESARNKITSAVIGIIILAASYAVLQLILSFLGVTGGLTGVFSSLGTINEPVRN